MKYYAKCLPCEGEIKIGSIVLETLTDGNTELFEIHTENDINLNNQKLVKLYLITYDKTVGDRVTQDGIKFQYWSDNHNGLSDVLNTYFTILGIVSQRAKWVKHGDEFNQDDIIFEAVHRSFRDMDIISENLEEHKKFMNQNSLPGKYKSYCLIKCDKCDTFH